MASILLINPNTSARSTEMMSAIARSFLPPGVVMRSVGASYGEAMILNEAALAIGADEVIRIGVAAVGTIDAIVVAAFGDPGAESLRALVPVPVVGIGESSIREAAAGGRRFGIATTTPQLLRCIEAIVHDLGLADRFTGVRLPDSDPLELAANPNHQEEALAFAAMQCIEIDGAEAVVIGGGPLSDTAARLRQRFVAAIIEPVPAAMRRVLKELASGS